jgi:hypothetical protein
MSSPNRDKIHMSAVAYDKDVHDWACWLVRRRASRTGESRPLVRTAIARELGVAAGRVERAEKRRIKNVQTWFYEKLRFLVAREIEREIAALTHELEILRRSASRLDIAQIAEVETNLAKARALLEADTYPQIAAE